MCITWNENCSRWTHFVKRHRSFFVVFWIIRLYSEMFGEFHVISTWSGMYNNIFACVGLWKVFSRLPVHSTRCCCVLFSSCSSSLSRVCDFKSKVNFLSVYNYYHRHLIHTQHQYIDDSISSHFIFLFVFTGFHFVLFISFCFACV